MSVFADTFALIAWLNPRDASHEAACNYLDAYSGKLTTTEWVLMELADALSSVAARGTVAAFIQAARNDPKFEVVGYESSVYEQGFLLFVNRPDKEWSLTDCISFGVMTERGLTDALTADHHFEQAGFVALLKY